MNTSFFSRIAVTALLFSAALASGQVNSTRVLTDAGTGAAGSIDGMELRGAGLFWWKFGATGEISPYQPTLGIKPGVSKYSLSLDRSGPFYMNQGGSFMAGAERDGSYAYFTANRGGSQVGLFRQPLSSAVNATPQRLVGIVAPEVSTGAIGRDGRNVYFAPTYAGGYTAVWLASFDDAGTFTGAGVVAEGTLHASAVRKFAFFNANLTGTYARWGLCLQADGALWRFGPLNGAALSPMTLLTTGVGDIGVRYEDGGVSVQVMHDEIYATTKAIVGGPAGRLLRINPATGAATTFFTDPAGGQLLAFGCDNNFLFVSRSGAPAGQILRRFLPFHYYITVPGVPSGTDWVTMETVSGTNLRSDGQWLYYTRGNDIWRIGTAVPAIQVDLEAFGIEAVQIVQDLNNSVPLVAGKPVLVRAYARIAVNTLASATRQPTATLGVTRNGVGAGIYYPLNQPVIGNTPASQRADYRSAATGPGDTTASFDFLIPAADVQAGTMQFTFTVNSSRSAVETGVANPYGNNTISTPVMSVVTTGVPRVTFMPVKVDARIHTLQTDPAAFWNQIGRAVSLLPVPDISVRTVNLLIEKPVVRFGIPPVVYRSFDLPANKDAALNWLRVAVVGSGIYFNGGDTHFVGMVDPGIENTASGGIFNGLGSRPGEMLLVRMEGGAGDKPWDSPLGGRTLAHELGHNYGLTHINFPVGGPEDTNGEYPYDTAKIGPASNTLTTSVYGWDPRTGNILDGANVADLMSYGNTRWPSPYTVNRLIPLIASENARPAHAAVGARAPVAAALSGEVFLVSGMLNVAQSRAELWPAQCVPAGTFDAAAVAASIAQAAQPQGHNYEIRQLDAAGAVLTSSPLVLERSGDGFTPGIGFVQFLAAAPDAVTLQIVSAGAILAELSGAGSAPVVAANVTEYAADTRVLQWSWSATDAEGDALFSTVHFSADGGTSWLPVVLLSGNASISLHAASLPGGVDCRLRVMVTDGFNSAVALSDSFALPTNPPALTIVGATENQKFDFGTVAELQAYAMDAEEGSLPRIGISWTLSGPETRSVTAGALPLAGLPPGLYAATASATDASGETGSTTLNFEVRPIAIPETTAPAFDGEVDDPSYVGAPRMRWTHGGSARVSARLIRSGGRLYVGFNDIPYRNSGTTRAIVGLRIDVDGSADSSPQNSDFAFRLDEDGRPSQLEGDGATLLLRAEPAEGFDTAMNAGQLSWSAEFSLPEAILGGAEHGARILLTMQLPDAAGALQTFSWPAQADPNSPATWAPVQFGALPAPANAAPLAHAGTDLVLDPVEDTSVVLDGSGSRDPEGQTLTYVWTQVSGEPVSLAGADTAHPTFSLSPVAAVTARRFELVVNDGELESAVAGITVTASPVAPPAPLPDVPRLAYHPDGTVEGHFTSADFGLSEFGGENGQDSFGSKGRLAIETSENLTDWTLHFETSPDLLGRLVFLDSAGADVPKRFYRARTLTADGVLAPGYALEFDGGTRNAQIPHTPALNAYPLTVSAWINTTDTGAAVGGIVSKYADTSTNGWMLLTQSGRVRGCYFRTGGSDVWDGTLGLDGGFVADGAWHHVAMVIGPAGGTLYVDGVARSNLNWVGTPGPCTTTQPVQIGRYSYYAIGFKGQIDEVSVWSTAMSGLQVLELGRRAPAGTEANLQGLWSLDDGTGTQVLDTSGNDRHGTLVNGPLWVPSTAPILR